MGQQLTTEQVLLLNNLMYMGNESPFADLKKGANLGEVINRIDTGQFNLDQDYGSFMTGKDWKNILQAVKADEELMNLTIVTSYSDNNNKGGYGMLFANESSGEAIVVFKGTGTGEWPDNFQGGGATDRLDGVSTPQQEDALAWYESLDLETYDTVTVTGHSKGGNKAKYITIRDDSVDRCISFDGQGFSDEFMEEYDYEISVNQSKIENHNVEDDYVNLLLNDVGETTYYKGQDAKSFIENHAPNTFLKFEDGNVLIVNGERNEHMSNLDEFLNSYLRTLSPNEKQNVLSLVGTLVEGGLNNMGMGEMVNLLLEGDNSSIVADLLGYLFKYQSEYPEILDALKYITEGLQMENLGSIIDGISNVVNSWLGRDIITAIADYGKDKASATLLTVLRNLLEGKWGISLSLEQVRKLFGVISETIEITENVELHKNGGDIMIESQDGSRRSDFHILISAIRNISGEFAGYQKCLHHLELKLGNIQMQDTRSMRDIQRRLEQQAERMKNHVRQMHTMKMSMDDILLLYQKAEDKNIDRIGAI